MKDCRREWRIVSKRGGLLDRVEDCTLEAQSAGGPLVLYIGWMTVCKIVAFSIMNSIVNSTVIRLL